MPIKSYVKDSTLVDLLFALLALANSSNTELRSYIKKLKPLIRLIMLDILNTAPPSPDNAGIVKLIRKQARKHKLNINCKNKNTIKKDLNH